MEKLLAGAARTPNFGLIMTRQCRELHSLHLHLLLLPLVVSGPTKSQFQALPAVWGRGNNDNNIISMLMHIIVPCRACLACTLSEEKRVSAYVTCSTNIC